MVRVPSASMKQTICFALAACVVSGCPEGADLANPDSFFAGASCDALPIFETSCDSSLCHETEDGLPPFGSIDLLAPGVANRLVGQPASYENVHDLAACPTGEPELLINSENPEQSLLLTKLTGQHACGDAMPIPNPPNALSDEDIDCVRRWIASAIENAPAEGPTTSGGAPGTGGAGGSRGTGGLTATGGTATGGAGSGGFSGETGGSNSGGSGPGVAGSSGAGSLR